MTTPDFPRETWIRGLDGRWIRIVAVGISDRAATVTCAIGVPAPAEASIELVVPQAAIPRGPRRVIGLEACLAGRIVCIR